MSFNAKERSFLFPMINSSVIRHIYFYFTHHYNSLVNWESGFLIAHIFLSPQNLSYMSDGGKIIKPASPLVQDLKMLFLFVCFWCAWMQTQSLAVGGKRKVHLTLSWSLLGSLDLYFAWRVVGWARVIHS